MATFTAEQAKARNIEKMGDALGEQYSALWQEVAWLYAKWREYEDLFGTKSSRVALLNRAAPAFFHLIQESLWENILLHLARLTDPPNSRGKPNLTVRSLSGLSSNPEIQLTLPALIEEAVNSTFFSRDWRNRRIAHKDLSLALDSPAVALEPANREHVRNALSAIVAVLNKIELVYLDSQTFFNMSSHAGGALSLLHVIDDDMKVKEEHKEKIKQGRWREIEFRPRDL